LVGSIYGKSSVAIVLPTKIRSIWPNGFREEFLKSANQKQESPVAAMFVNGSELNEQYLAILVSDWLISKISSVKRKITLV
jgi:hypothetical protein